MVEDNLYNKVSISNIILGQYITYLKIGVIAIRSGPVLTATDFFNIRIFGRGGHGSQP